MNLHDVFLRIRALIAPRRVERELDEELAFHIERETQKQIAAGFSAAEARTRARARFGSVPLAADQCRDARGIGLVDDLKRDVLYAFRAYGRAPLAALTIVLTVALGLGLVTAVFLVYSTVLFRVDAVRNPEELFAVEQRTALDGEGVPLSRRDYDAMRRDTSVFADAAALLSTNDVATLTRTDGRPAVGGLVTGNFFQMLGVGPQLGRALMPADDEPGDPRPVIVLSDAGWRKLFDADRAVVGRQIGINGTPFEIVGVMPEGFRGLGLTPPDYWAPLWSAGLFRDAYAGQEDVVAIDVIGRLKPEMSPEAAASSLTGWASGRIDPESAAGRVTVRLTPRDGTLPTNVVGMLAVFSPLFFAFGLILLIGCANVANLLLARSLSRQREIGVRLSLGASRRRVVRQLLTESLLLSLAAAACGLVLSRLILEGLLYAAITMSSPEIAQLLGLLNISVPAPDWRVLLFIAAGAVVSAVVFGLAPALQATRLDLVRTMRGEVTRDARPSRARHALIAMQVGASALLLISAVVFLKSALWSASEDPGIRTSDTVRISIPNEPRRAALLQAVTTHPSVAIVAASSTPSSAVIDMPAVVDAAKDGRPETSSRVSVGQLSVSSEYFDVLGFEVVRGRGFAASERTADAGVVVLSETIARRLWPNSDVVGQPVRIESRRPSSKDGLTSRTLTVIGVVRDPGRDSGASYLETFRGVYLPASIESPGTWLMLRVRGNPDRVRQVLLDHLTIIDPAVSNIVTLRAIAALRTNMLQVGFWLTMSLGGLALVLTVSGLFSVLSYVVEQQAKEIGVRMALGAATKNIVQLVLMQSLRPVAIGLAAGGGLATAVAIVLLTTAAASEIGGWVRVADPTAYGLSLLAIVVSCAAAVSVPALRATRIDPIATLRKD